MDFPYFEWLFGSGNPPFSTHCGTSAALAGTPSVGWPLLDHLMPIVTAGKDFAPEKSWIMLDIKCQLYNLYPTLVSNISIQHVGYTSVPHIF
jgi:hypothetical protein